MEDVWRFDSETNHIFHFDSDHWVFITIYFTHRIRTYFTLTYLDFSQYKGNTRVKGRQWQRAWYIHFTSHLNGEEDGLPVGAERESAAIAVDPAEGDGQQLQEHGEEADPLRTPTKHDFQHLRQINIFLFYFSHFFF